jgi:hypothetical protein
MDKLQSLLVRVMILFKIDLLKQLKKLFFRLNHYNGLERIAIGSTELKRYNDLSIRYTFHESL